MAEAFITIDSDTALMRLIDGNERFVNGLRLVESMPTLGRLRSLAEKGQRPFAMILTCSDSRVPTEIVFDQGLGDLFVVRVAGNVVAPSLVASMEFAATQFETSLLMVMGHSACGAINAAIKHKTGKGGELTPNLLDLVERIRPAVKSHDCEEVVRSNVLHSMSEIRKSSAVLNERVESGKLKIVGGVFDFTTGRVDFLTPESDRKATATPWKPTSLSID